MPVGKIKFYDAEKGFGFINADESGSVYVNASALPAGVTSLKPGTRVEFEIVDGRRGAQALSVTVLQRGPSISRAKRPRPEEMAVIVEDLIKLLDGASNSLRHGRYPDGRNAEKIASVLRAVADDFEA